MWYWDLVLTLEKCFFTFDTQARQHLPFCTRSFPLAYWPSSPCLVLRKIMQPQLHLFYKSRRGTINLLPLGLLPLCSCFLEGLSYISSPFLILPTGVRLPLPPSATVSSASVVFLILLDPSTAPNKTPPSVTHAAFELLILLPLPHEYYCQAPPHLAFLYLCPFSVIFSGFPFVSLVSKGALGTA